MSIAAARWLHLGAEPTASEISIALLKVHMSEEPKWKRFEKLVASIQQQLSPQADVQANVRMPGKLSGKARQLDIVVRQYIGQFELFIVIECKDYSRPVNVKTVEEFLGLVADVGAHKGALVSSSQFTAAAKERARKAGVELLYLVDAESKEWPVYVSVPAMVEVLALRGYRFNFTWHRRLRVDVAPLVEEVIYANDGSRQGTVRELFLRAWNSGVLPLQEGLHEEQRFLQGDLFMRVGGELCQVLITADLQVQKSSYFGHLPITSVKGFADALSSPPRITFTNGFGTGWLVLDEVIAKWQSIASRESLAVQPALSFVVSSIVSAGLQNDSGVP